jgi:hypothetical protein
MADAARQGEQSVLFVVLPIAAAIAILLDWWT